MATLYTLNVHIGANFIQLLKDSEYYLCFAKQVNGVYNVIWFGTDTFVGENTFEWAEQYQVYTQDPFKVRSYFMFYLY